MNNHSSLILIVASASLVFSLLSLIALGTLIRIYMATPPVSQATFDAALNQQSSLLQTLLTLVGELGVGLSNVEASLIAAQGSATPVDLTGELASVQAMQAQISNTTATVQQEISAIPTADQPPAPAAPTS